MMGLVSQSRFEPATSLAQVGSFLLGPASMLEKQANLTHEDTKQFILFLMPCEMIGAETVHIKGNAM
jgi:hypothetical protein